MQQNRFAHRVKVKEELTVEDRGNISFLINAIFWFTDCVFIMEMEDGYRLISIHQGRLLVNKRYKQARNAKIAFTRFFNNKIWERGIKPMWSPFYPPAPGWLKRKFENLES